MKSFFVFVGFLAMVILTLPSYASEGVSAGKLDELYVEHKDAIANIIRIEQNIFKMKYQAEALKEEIKDQIDENHYLKTIGALERASKKTATASDKDHMDTFAIAYSTDSEIRTELVDAKRKLEEGSSLKKQQSDLLENIKKEQSRLLSEEVRLEKTRSKMDKTISALNQENVFRLWISGAFTILVALVISGFFLIVLKKENISSDIFSGEKGIQFITLFLIIIAVILFGIMGILESRELSALLGALSGYILGRTSVQRRELTQS